MQRLSASASSSDDSDGPRERVVFWGCYLKEQHRHLLNQPASEPTEERAAKRQRVTSPVTQAPNISKSGAQASSAPSIIYLVCHDKHGPYIDTKHDIVAAFHDLRRANTLAYTLFTEPSSDYIVDDQRTVLHQIGDKYVKDDAYNNPDWAPKYSIDDDDALHFFSDSEDGSGFVYVKKMFVE